jgi:putative ABC transport system ATP-binding protein
MTGNHPNIIIQMQDVVKTYGTDDVPFAALNHVNIDIKQGEFLGITGKSGAGKTTLLNMISGVSKLTSGNILFHWIGHESSSPSIPITSLNEDKLALWRGENLGIIYQSFELMPTLSLVENVMLPPDFLGSYQPLTSKKRALELLDLVEIVDHAYKIPAHISGGQKQRVAIARALVNDPHLIIADEPTGNLDSRAADNVLNLFQNLASRGKTILIVTHDPSITERTDQTIILSDGEIIDQTIARALPFLTHPQMLAATRQAKKQKVAPGAMILQQGESVEHFFMIVSGEVEIIVKSEQTKEMRLARLGHGQFFGEVELTQGGRSMAQVQGAGSGAELALLPKELFYELIDGSALTRQTIHAVAATRLAESRRRKSDH